MKKNSGLQRFSALLPALEFKNFSLRASAVFEEQMFRIQGARALARTSDRNFIIISDDRMSHGQRKEILTTGSKIQGDLSSLDKCFGLFQFLGLSV